MLQEERFNRILSELSEKGAVKVSELAELMHTSESTIRRDINGLSSHGRLKKVFGGAVPVEKNIVTHEREIASKNKENLEEKTAIVKYAASLIEDDEFVFLDCGSTIEKMADFIENDSVIYVTNSITVMKKLSDKGFITYLTGGRLKNATQALVGTEALHFLSGFNFSRSFIGAAGIDIKRGYSTPGIEEASIKRMVMDNSTESYILADGSKFGIVSSVSFGSVEKGTIITDFLPDSEYRRFTRITEVMNK